MEAYRSCVRDNARTLELARAAEEVARSAANLRAQGSRAAVTDYQRSLLERQWQYYKSLGGTAATPDAVQVPADPCAPIAETLRRQQMEDYAQYRQCAAERERDVRLATLSKELVESRSWIAAAERMQAERAANPARFQDTRGSGEWARLARIDPAQLRAAQGAMFLEYPASGGPAARGAGELYRK